MNFGPGNVFICGARDKVWWHRRNSLEHNRADSVLIVNAKSQLINEWRFLHNITPLAVFHESSGIKQYRTLLTLFYIQQVDRVMTISPRCPQQRQVNPHRQERRISSTPLSNPLGEMAEQYSIAPRSQVNTSSSDMNPWLATESRCAGPFRRRTPPVVHWRASVCSLDPGAEPVYISGTMFWWSLLMVM
jgi:hypothetical protein